MPTRIRHRAISRPNTNLSSRGPPHGRPGYTPIAKTLHGSEGPLAGVPLFKKVQRSQATPCEEADAPGGGQRRSRIIDSEPIAVSRRSVELHLGSERPGITDQFNSEECMESDDRVHVNV